LHPSLKNGFTDRTPAPPAPDEYISSNVASDGHQWLMIVLEQMAFYFVNIFGISFAEKLQT
jgi:hypothetical protein